ncbi:ABC transporter arginine-binding protein 1 [compost metagenome]
MIPNLLAGKYDVIVASMAITAERQKLISFTRKYYSNQGRFIKRKGDDLGMFDANGLAGKVIAVQSHTTHQKFLEAQYSSSQIVPFPDTEAALAALAEKKVDLVFADTYMLFSWLKGDAGACCIFVGPRASDPSVMGEGKGIGVRKENVELLNSLNAALDSILQDGTYREINERYFPFSIYK